MKEKLSTNKYFAWGFTAFCVLCSLLLLFFAFYRWDYIVSLLKNIIGIIMPIIFGLSIAYLMNPVVTFFEKKIFIKLVKKIKRIKNTKKVARALSLFMSTILFFGVLIGCFSILIPEIINSINNFITNVNTYLSDSEKLLLDIFGNHEAVITFIEDNYSNFSDFFIKWLNDGYLNDMMTYLGNGIYSILIFLYNLIIGYIISIYVLFDKEKFKGQTKKLLYTLFDKDKVNIILENANYTDRIFGGFFAGKIIDSAIIGIICFVGMVIFDIPYALVIAVVVGITNIIPYFGPFIGAIPSALLIFLVEPSKCITFLIFIFILQQFDGNILGPKILGNKTGLSSFWVLCSLLIFGGLFGVVGMIVGVPIFSILYSFINSVLKRKLEVKKLPTSSKDYISNEDEENIEKVKKAKEVKRKNKVKKD